MFKYGVCFGPYFPVFVLNTGKYNPEKTPYLDTFHAMLLKSYTLYLTMSSKNQHLNIGKPEHYQRKSSRGVLQKAALKIFCKTH